jgi:hypothetical protein
VARIAALICVGGAAAAAAAVALAAQSPKAVRSAIFAAARGEHSVHYVSRSSGSGSTAVVADVGATRGIQRITFRKGGASGRATVLVVSRTAYILGDAFSLRGFFGFSASQAKRYKNQWITIPHTSPAFGTVAAAVTLGSFLTEVYPQANLARVRGSVDGRQVVGVRGVSRHEGERVVETVYARAKGAPLPVEEKETGSAGFHGLTRVGPWNRPVRVQAPGHAVPASLVLGH